MTLLEPQHEGIPLPRPTPVTEAFWDGCAAGRLLFQRCSRCGAAQFNPAPLCRVCTGSEFDWEPSAGRGTVYSYTIAWRPQSPRFSTPYAPIIVDLDEGVQILSNVIRCSVEDVHVGMRVAVEFVPVGPVTLPYFRPA
jgi:uncharacterized OB-fold protein